MIDLSCAQKNHLEDDSQVVQRTSSLEATQASTSTETHLCVGHNLQIDDTDDDMDNATPNVSADSTGTAEPIVASEGRYPRQEHRAPSSFNDFVPLNVSDESSA